VLYKKIAATWFISVAAISTAQAQSAPIVVSQTLFADDEARRAIIDLRARTEVMGNKVKDLERALQNSAQGQIRLLNENESMRSEIAKLRGQIELLESAARTSKSQQQDLFLSLERRIQEQGQALGSYEAKLKALEPVNFEVNGVAYRVSQREIDLFEDLRAAIGAKEFKKAIRLSIEFEKEQPNSNLFAEVLFLKGTALYADRDLPGSVSARREFIELFPRHPSVPPARLNLAAALTESGNPKSARRALEDLIRLHPQSQEASEARKRLK
jgi:TolA-binding protein